MNTLISRLIRLSAVTLILWTLAIAASAQSGWLPTRINTGGNDLNTVYFLDEKRGWVGGDEGFLSRTDDGGNSWARQSVGTTAAINDIYFRDKEIGFLLAGNSIFVTRDNGATWNKSRSFLPEEFEGAEVELYSVRFSSKNKGWVVGSVSKRERVVDSILVYTDDAGQSWRRQRAPSRLELIHIDFVSDKRGWIVGADGTILFTRDSGESWTKQNTGTNAHPLPHRFSRRQTRLGRRRARHVVAHHGRRRNVDADTRQRQSHALEHPVSKRRRWLGDWPRRNDPAQQRRGQDLDTTRIDNQAKPLLALFQQKDRMGCRW